VAGPRIKPTIDTSGDAAYEVVRRHLLRAKLLELRQHVEQAAALVDEPVTTRAAAAEWVFDHGGTIAAALKATHPDHGGTAADFQRTMQARSVLEGRAQR
jgi:hypothetical protein